MEEVALPLQVEHAFEFQAHLLARTGFQPVWNGDGLIRIGDLRRGDFQDAFEVLPRGFRHDGDVVCAAHDILAQGHEHPLVVEGGMGQAQRDQVVEGVDVGHVPRVQRQRAGPMHDVGPWGLGGGVESHGRRHAIGLERAIGEPEQRGCGPEAVGVGAAAAPARPDDLA
ncbi:hypothetical protein D3C80_1183740 [compost metagenome]